MKSESRSITPRAEVVSPGIDQELGSFILRQALRSWLPGGSDRPSMSLRERARPGIPESSSKGPGWSPTAVDWLTGPTE